MRFLLRSVCAAAVVWAAAAQEGSVHVRESALQLPTHDEGDPEIIPSFDQLALNGNVFVYPYTFRWETTDRIAPESWRTLELENEFLHCRILPDLGGHLYSCRDKLSGAEMFYTNASIKKATIAPRGVWAALGIEANFPVAHSRVTVSPVHFATVRHLDGSASAYVGSRDRATGMDWQVAYTLHPGVAALEEKVWLYNAAQVRQPFQWWSNAAIRLPDSGLRYTYPMYVTEKHGPGDLDSWPINTAGQDLSHTKSYTDPIGLFAYGSRDSFFAVHDPQSRNGVSHWADPKVVPGKKIWSWGGGPNQRRGLLSDDNSGYVEIQAGLLSSQDDFEFLEPGQSRSFSEWWIPSRDTTGISRANPNAVISLHRYLQPDGSVKLAVDLNVLRPGKGTLTVSRNGTSVWERSADFTPASTFHAETEALTAAGKFQVELKSAAGEVLLRHEEDGYDAIGTKEVKLGPPPKKATDRRSREQDYLEAGQRAELNRLRDTAMNEYRAGSARNSGSVALQKAAGRLAVNLGRFDDAVARLTAAQKGGGDAETAYYLGLAKAGVEDDSGAIAAWKSAAADAVFGPPSRFEIAAATGRAGDFQAAAELFHELSAAGMQAAVGLEAALLRRAGQAEQAKAAAARALAVSPLDSLARVEAVLGGRSDPGLWPHLAADPEWVLDVVDAYFHAGLYEDALPLLERKYPAVPRPQTEPGAVLPQDYPLIAYYRGYARQHLGRRADEDYKVASSQSPRYVFPSRPSSFAVLVSALEQNPEDFTARYLLGCLYMSARMTDEAVAEWKKARPAGNRIPGYYETVFRVLSKVKGDAALARAFVQQAAAEDEAAARLLSTIAPGNTAAATTPSAAAQAANAKFANPAHWALNMAAAGQLGRAADAFTPQNFPDERQPLEVRQAYIEVGLRRIVVAAKTEQCQQVKALIETLGDAKRNLWFTLYGFGDILALPRTQYYIGLAQSVCGDAKRAEKTWSKLAKASAPVSSPDFAFPYVARLKIDPAGSQRSIETALETVRMGGGSVDKDLLLYSEGVLLRALGRDEEARERLTAAAASATFLVQYLAKAALGDPPLR